ncbi:hypothetical protein DFA_12145 [Cavenderia fasciculata]|uniref:VWFA domain-containing protein n=1 Tax=Cavenderia fasciculata TaxID=261658 RepID=F4QC92_CACFS|nr:uncharacterized protein DFA_12145 [Cavenderia fasciculata]EGG14373.1 hypothetical protein DFA_12145 [Cavenderia fasciculata]|eukprot:XP_004353782.1 hypothetical protein DFA_12145 [Cavenderia fasciculata]
MLILIKTPTITFSLDVQPDESTEVLYTKVAERTEYKRFQFELLFAGDKIGAGSVGASGIKKEATVHMVVIKELKYTVSYEGKEYNLALPNNDGLQISHLQQQIKRSLVADIPEVSSHKIEIYKPGTSTVITQYTSLQSSFSNFDTIELKLVAPPVSKKSSSYSSKVASGSGSSSSSDDEGDSYSKSSYSSPSKPIVEEQFDKDALLSSFVESSISSDVEICFCFDTTGSMSSIIQNVKTQVENTVKRLMKDIPSIRIGIMGLGDYCDGKLVLTTQDLTQDVTTLVKFIKNVPSTSGGDAPEAYEFALMKAKELTWSEHTSKAFVMIGDSNPHQPTFTDLNINWFKECDDLHERGIKIYGVKALGSSIFYNDIAERTGGICIDFKKFDLITEMFLAICYREASSKKFKEYEGELAKKGGENKDLQQILTDLNKENYVVEMTKEGSAEETKKPEEEEVKKEEETTSTTSTTTTPPLVVAAEEETKKPVVKVIKKQYGYPSEIKSKESWYDIANDKGKPSYYYNHTLGYFTSSKSTNPQAYVPPTPPPTVTRSTTGADGSSASTVNEMFTFSSYDFSAHEIESFKPTSLIAYVFGDTGIGKTTFVNSINYVAKEYKNMINFRDVNYSLDKYKFREASLFIICYDGSKKDTYENVPKYIQEIRKHDISKPIAIIALKDDLTSALPLNPTTIKSVYSVVGFMKYSSYYKHEEIKNIAYELKYSLGGNSRKSCSIILETTTTTSYYYSLLFNLLNYYKRLFKKEERESNVTISKEEEDLFIINNIKL